MDTAIALAASLAGLLMGAFLWSCLNPWRTVRRGRPYSVSLHIQRPRDEHGGRAMVAVTMTNRQRFGFKVTVRDEDGEPFAAKKDLPEGCEVTIDTSDAGVAKVTVDETGLGVRVNSGHVGTGVVTVNVSGGGIGPFTDAINVNVVNSLPKSVGLDIEDLEVEDADGDGVED